MDFREMLYITTVADCRSITAAARKLYISQPSLSHIVSKVEQDVGVKLFDRGTSPLTITYAGEKYVETARKILQSWYVNWLIVILGLLWGLKLGQLYEAAILKNLIIIKLLKIDFFEKTNF